MVVLVSNVLVFRLSLQCPPVVLTLKRHSLHNVYAYIYSYLVIIHVGDSSTWSAISD